MTTTLTTLTAQDVEELIATRRDLHRHPELGFEEVRTSGIVQARLKELGIPFRAGLAQTGVTALIGKGAAGGPTGKVVLLRADMDALPIHEENDVPYRSTIDGKMHACGHDCHTSTLLSLARALKRDEASLPGTIKLCFQPAEEGFMGAERMIQDGALEGPKPDAAFGYHISQDLDLGTVSATPGAFMAAVDEFSVTVKGKGAHAAHPDHGIDPVLAAAHITAALQQIASRVANPLKSVVVSVTQIRAGSAFNIIPETCWMNGTMRVFDDELWAQLPGLFERVVTNTAVAFGCTAEIKIQRLHRPTVNNPEMAALARKVAAEVVGKENVRDDYRTMGGEDFSSFLAAVPGCFLMVGSRNPAKGFTYGHHHPRFDVDERGMEIGAEILARLAKTFLES
jgi:amidohydrolase